MRLGYRWFAVGAASALTLLSTIGASANVPLTKISSDPYTNSTSQHATQVEPDTFSFGNTIVAAFQEGRFTDGGSSNIGWATSADGGTTWTHGDLPGTTVYATPAGSFARDTDPAVAYDPKRGVWLIAQLPLDASVNGAGVIVSRSTNGGTVWGNPITVVPPGGINSDKSWIVCDTWASSPFYGNCYIQWDDHGAGNLIYMNTSTDGGLTWGPKTTTAQGIAGIGGQPVVQPSGTVVVPLDNANETAVGAFSSTNGGASWGNVTTITSISHHTDAGNIRSGALPTAEIDGAGKVFVAWSDSRFIRAGKANDIVFTSSSMFQGLGNTVPPLLSSASRLVLFALPALLLSQKPGFDIKLVWYLSVGSQVLQACINLLLLRRELHKKLRFEEADGFVPASATAS